MNIKNISKAYNVNIVHSTTKKNCAETRFEKLKKSDDTIDNIIYKIENTIRTKESKHLSCSSIKQGDNEKCFFGPIGVILKDGIITYASPIDGGTYFDGEKLITLPSNVPLDNQIDKAINHNTCSYNEFRIDNPKVYGIYINVNDIRLYNEISNINDFIHNISYFDLPIFVFENGTFSEINLDNTEIIRKKNERKRL